MEPAVQRTTARDMHNSTKDRLTKQGSENKIIQRQVFIVNTYSKNYYIQQFLTGIENIKHSVKQFKNSKHILRSKNAAFKIKFISTSKQIIVCYIHFYILKINLVAYLGINQANFHIHFFFFKSALGPHLNFYF